MVLRLLVPVGVAGGAVVGLSGVFPSLLQTRTSVQERGDRIKKVEVDKNISAKVDCVEGEAVNGGGSIQQAKKATFEWMVKLGTDADKNLARRESVEAEATVSLKEGDKSLWPNRKGGIFVEGEKGNIKIQYSDGEKVRKFICQVNSGSKGKKTEIYNDGKIWVDGLGGIKIPMDITIRLGECNPNSGGENPSECPLQVTDGSDLDWSEKVTTKAKVSWE